MKNIIPFELFESSQPSKVEHEISFVKNEVMPPRNVCIIVKTDANNKIIEIRNIVRDQTFKFRMHERFDRLVYEKFAKENGYVVNVTKRNVMLRGQELIKHVIKRGGRFPFGGSPYGDM